MVGVVADVPDIWMFLDSQSTVDLICNRNLVTNIQEVIHYTRIYCNIGQLEQFYGRSPRIQGDEVPSNCKCKHCFYDVDKQFLC